MIEKNTFLKECYVTPLSTCVFNYHFVFDILSTILSISSYNLSLFSVVAWTFRIKKVLSWFFILPHIFYLISLETVLLFLLTLGPQWSLPQIFLSHFHFWTVYDYRILVFPWLVNVFLVRLFEYHVYFFEWHVIRKQNLHFIQDICWGI